MISLQIAQMRWPDFVHIIANREANMALYYLLLRLWVRLGTDEATMRTLSVIFVVATLPVFYALAVRLFDRRVALVGSLLLAVNWMLLSQAQWVRGYSLAIFTVTLASLCFARGIYQPSIRNWAAYAVTGILAVYSHFFAAFVLVSHWLSVAWLPRRAVPWRALAASVAAIGLLAQPLVLFALTRDVGQIAYLPRPSVRSIADLFVTDMAGGGWMRSLPYLVACVVAVIVFGRAWRASGTSADTWRYGLLVIWLVLPIVLAFGASMIKPLWAPRYFVVCLTPFVLLTAVGLAQIRPQPILVAVLVVMVGLAIDNSFSSWAFHTRQDWRGATAYLLAQVQPEDAVIVYSDPGMVDFYRERLRPARGLPVAYPVRAGSHGDLLDRAMLERLAHAPRLWMMGAAPLQHYVAARAIQAFLAGRYRAMTEKRFDGIILELYSRRRGSLP